MQPLQLQAKGPFRRREVCDEILNVVFRREIRVLAAMVHALSFARALFLFLSEYNLRKKTHVTSAGSLGLGSSKFNAINLTQ